MQHLQVQLIGDASAPFYAHEGDAGLDLAANENVVLRPMQRKVVGTGLRVRIPDGCVGDVRPRSGLASKMGVTVVNSPGTIDSNYRGEVGVPLINLGTNTAYIERGDRIAQLVVTEYVPCRVAVVESLDETERGEGGFGSTGIK